MEGDVVTTLMLLVMLFKIAIIATVCLTLMVGFLMAV